MNRPSTPGMVLTHDEYFPLEGDQYECVQEALTCEWDIDRGAMPDPSEFVASGGKAATVLIQGVEHPVWIGNPNLNGWQYVDRDPHGKPSDYEVKR